MRDYLGKDPLNFNTLEEYLKYHHPELLEEIEKEKGAKKNENN